MISVETRMHDGPTVALLDDQRVLVEALARVLGQSGLRIVAACTTPSDLLGAVRVRPPDVFLVDLRLSPDREDPSEEAWQVIQFIRTRHPEVKVLILSSSRDPADVQRADHLRVAGFLNKDDLSTQDLVNTIQQVARGERVFPVIRPAARPSPLDGVAAPLNDLTPREIEVLRYVGAGLDNMKIAGHLNITERTVRAHVSALYRKLGSENRAQLAILSRELGLRPPEL